ncbi:hypothetical protein [Puia dinghuensis]|uniref:Glycosyltransferase RgtA/B/C/D-like domain-containing protein n=1 Tax=Puia dinghuensis TaxID=1792502 RepID=A0A8J2UGT4_9BACT|nr:hypothetical protein [Puia dinghuensis]GGB14997.1 hypothetical protein GCM10011511_43430 [Puia dinghuensis]
MNTQTPHTRTLWPAIAEPRRTILLLSAASLLLSLLYCPPVDLFYDDTEIFRYFGRLIVAGGVPYRDVFDHKPPLIFFFCTAGPWGLWLLNTALVLTATLLFLRLCRRCSLPWPWLPPLFFNLLIRNYMICIGITMTRAYTAIFLLLFFCLMLDDNRRYRHYWLGLLAAATFFMQQDGLIVLLPLLLYAFLPAPNRAPTTLIRTAWFPALAGAATITLPLLGYFAAHHALTQLWQDAFVFNFRWYMSKPTPGEHFRVVKQALQDTDLQMPFILATVLGACALLYKHKKKRLLVAALATLILSFAAEGLSGMLEYGHAFWYYFLPLSVSLPILVFVVWAYTEESWLREKKSQLLYGFLLCCMPLYDAGQHATHLANNHSGWVTDLPEYRYLRQHRPTDRQLYAFGDNNWVRAYNEFGIFSPCHWIYHHFWGWYPGWDPGHKQLSRIETDLLHYHTKYLIYNPAINYFKDASARTEWESFLAKYYRLQLLSGSTPSHLWISLTDSSPAQPAPQTPDLPAK